MPDRSSLLTRTSKVLLGIALLPFCAGFAWQLAVVSLGVRYRPLVPYWFAGGFILYAVIHFLFKKPILSYVVGHELTRDSMRSMVKRRTSRIDTILPVTTKDGKVLRITMTCLTLTRANLSQVHAIRSAMTRFIQSYAAQREFPAFTGGGIY